MKMRMHILLALAIAGFFFSGYLSMVKLMSNSCAFNEPCPYVFGYPACWYGFALFAAMLIVTVCGEIFMPEGAAKGDLFLSAVGILFSGTLVVEEYVGSGVSIVMRSSCTYGLLFYIAILIVSVLVIRRIRIL